MAPGKPLVGVNVGMDAIFVFMRMWVGGTLFVCAFLTKAA